MHVFSPSVTKDILEDDTYLITQDQRAAGVRKCN